MTGPLPRYTMLPHLMISVSVAAARIAERSSSTHAWRHPVSASTYASGLAAGTDFLTGSSDRPGCGLAQCRHRIFLEDATTRRIVPGDQPEYSSRLVVNHRRASSDRR